VGRYAFRSHRDGGVLGSGVRASGSQAPAVLLNKELFQARTVTYMMAKADDLGQSNSQSTISAEARSFTETQIPIALTRSVSTTPKAAAATVGCLCIGVGRHPERTSGRVRHNLVHSLTAQPETVRNLRQGLPLKACLPDIRVSCDLTARARSQWAPLPTREHLQGTDTIRRKFTFSVTLPGVVHPIAKAQLLAIENFDMDRRDFTMVFPDPELIESTDVHKELLRMIHTSTIEGDGKDHNSYRSLPGYGGGNHGF